MWKQARESGLSLAELLVVLAITVVLAAILLPAINTPTHAGNTGDSGLDPYVVAADESMEIDPQIPSQRRSVRERDVPAVDDSTDRDVAVLPDFHAPEAETLPLDGLKAIKTTDISYKLP